MPCYILRMIGKSLGVSLLFVILYSSTSHSLPSAANTSNPTNNSTAWNPYDFQPPPPPTYHSPWLPPEDFYDNFDPYIADIVKNRVQDMLADWRNHHLPPLYHCRYTCEQYKPRRHPSRPQAHDNPTPHDVQENTATTPPPTHDDNPTTPPPPDNCPTMDRVMEACTTMRQHETVSSAYSWSCTYSDQCCKETLNVHNECLNLNPSITWLKTICCNSSTTPEGGETNA